MTSFFPREAPFKPPSRRSPTLILYHSPFLFTDNIISIMGDGGEAFCLFCVFCGLKIRVFRAFCGS